MRLQIGVMGSAADLNYADELARLAEEVGEYVARDGGGRELVLSLSCDSMIAILAQFQGDDYERR